MQSIKSNIQAALISVESVQNIVPSVVIALQILFTIPVLAASGKWSFSKLVLIKTYHQNSMGQERLSDVAIILIENDVANSIEYDDVIEDFATAIARKKSGIWANNRVSGNLEENREFPA